MTLTNTIISILISYLLGSFQASYLFGKAIKKVDIRNYGSGNPGATNAIRVFGLKFGLMCLFVDALKGFLAIILIKAFFGPELLLLQLISGIFVVLGHNHPFYMGFKGGKGVAATIGIVLAIDWRIFLLAGLPALIVLLLTRIMSLASLSFEFLIFVFFIFFNFQSADLLYISLISVLYPVVSFWRHKNNIFRLISGEEPKLFGKGSKKVVINKDNNEKDKNDHNDNK